MNSLFDISNLTIQTFDDSSERKDNQKQRTDLARIFSFDLKTIEELQTEGAGVYFSPNRQILPNQRGILNTKEFKFLSLDLDVAKEAAKLNRDDIASLKKELFKKLSALEIPPTVIVITKNGLQSVWEFLDPKQLDTEEERIDANTLYRRMVLGVTKILNHSSEGDSLARVIRYPKTRHLKDLKNPYVIESREVNSSPTTFEAFTRAYPPAGIEAVSTPYAEIIKGVEIGNRFEMGNRLLGHWLKIHKPEEFETIVWPMFEIWNKYCEPPTSTQVLREIYEGIAKRELSKEMVVEESLIDKFEEEQSSTQFTLKSGFNSLDKSINGFKSGGLYVLAGLKKSGKSSLLMNILNNIMDQGTKVGFINTELSFNQFVNRFAAVHGNLSVKEVEKNSSIGKTWLKNNKDLLFYADKKKVQRQSGFSKEALKAILTDWVRKGVKVVCFDNLTTVGTETREGLQGWQLLADFVDELVDFAKENSIVIFTVIHTKPHLVFSETPAGISHLVKENKLLDIFKDSITINRRPNSADLYGGGSALSQISGGVLLLWRPFQDFNSPEYRELTQLILEDFREGSLLSEIDLVFDLNKLKFREQYDTTATFENLEKATPEKPKIGPLYEGDKPPERKEEPDDDIDLEAAAEELGIPV